MDLKEAMQYMNIDVDNVLSRFSGNSHLMERFVKKFPQDNTFTALQMAYKNKDYNQIEREAHTLKGIAANLGFDRLFQLSAEIVSDLRADNRENIDRLMNALREEYDRLIGWINQID